MRPVLAALSVLLLATPAGATAPDAAHPAAREVDAVDAVDAVACGAAAVAIRLRAQVPPYGGSACPGVRPGASVTTPTGGCTLGFVLSGSDRRRYVATAGHCATTATGEFTWRPGLGPVAGDAGGRPIGRFVYAVNQDRVDFALIRLDPGVRADPTVCHFGGPTGLNRDVQDDLTELRHFGQGLGESVAPARTAYAPFGLYREDYAYAWGVAYFGDSGGPVLDASGRAVGLVTELVASGLGDIGINRLAPHLARVQNLLRLRLTLLQAPAA